MEEHRLIPRPTPYPGDTDNYAKVDTSTPYENQGSVED
ncbi:hypothetical protein SP41_27 [Salmonella phage 41]|nr:hypothetical protein SP41_27 [Salmonella phage 41]